MDQIRPDMKVAEVIDRHPETVEISFEYDCPDMRSGFFRIMASIMSVRAAAWMHGIPLEDLVRDLNEAAGRDER